MDEQFDSNITYDPNNANSLPAFHNYMASKSYFPSIESITNERLWMVQAQWQYGGLGNNPVGNEEDTDLNAKGAAKINENSYGFLNFVEVDNVCNGAAALTQAVDDFNNDSTPPAVSNCLTNGKVLIPGESLESVNGAFRAQLDTDGLFCIYEVQDMSQQQWCEGGMGAPVESGEPGVLKMVR
jgi:hypothetical protein